MTTGAMLRYPSMSITLPQRMSEAPVGPDASSFDGSTLRPLEGPAAAEYIKLATSSNVTAATANTIAARLEMLGLLVRTFPGGGEPVGLELRFGNVGGSPTLGSTRGVLGLFIGGEQQHDHGAVRVFEDLSGRLEAVDARQGHIHQHQVGGQAQAVFDRSLAGLGFGNHFEAIRRLDHGPRRLPERRLIINDQYPYCHVSSYRMAGFGRASNCGSTTRGTPREALFCCRANPRRAGRGQLPGPGGCPAADRCPARAPGGRRVHRL